MRSFHLILLFADWKLFSLFIRRVLWAVHRLTSTMRYDVKETSCWTWVIVAHDRFKRFEIGSPRVSQSYVILFVHWSGRLFGSKNPDYHSNTAAVDVNGKMKQETFSHFRVQQKIPGLLYHEPILRAPKPRFFCCHQMKLTRIKSATEAKQKWKVLNGSGGLRLSDASE